jgi:hypothetical protein
VADTQSKLLRTSSVFLLVSGNNENDWDLLVKCVTGPEPPHTGQQGPFPCRQRRESARASVWWLAAACGLRDQCHLLQLHAARDELPDRADSDLQRDAGQDDRALQAARAPVSV